MFVVRPTMCAQRTEARKHPTLHAANYQGDPDGSWEYMDFRHEREPTRKADLNAMRLSKSLKAQHGPQESRGLSQLCTSKLVIALGLFLSPRRSLFLLTIHVHGISLALLGRVGDLGYDIVEEVKLVILGDGLLEVDGSNALRVTRLGFGGSLSDEGDHEEFECFCCGRVSI